MKTKRLFIFVVVLFLSLFLFACNMAGGTEGGDDAESIVLNAINNVAIRYAEGDSAESVTQNIVLASSDVVNFAWSSDNEAISNLGVVTRGEEDVKVKLTLKATFGDISLEKSFNVTVKGTKEYNDNPGENNDNPGENNDNPGGNNDNPGGNNDNPGGNNETPTGDYTDISVLIAAGVGDAEYTIKGKIDNIANTTYGNMTISDATGSMFLYGLYNAEGAKYGDFTDYKPVEGDTIVVKGAVSLYNEALEIKNAVLISVEKGSGNGNTETPPVTPPETTDAVEGSIADVLAAATDTVYKVKGVTVVCLYARGYLVTDGTNYILVYKNAEAFDVAVGDKVDIEGKITAYHNRNQFGTDTVASNKATGTLPTDAIVALDASAMTAFIANPVMGKFVKVSGSVVIDGNYVNVKIEGTDKIVSVQYPEEAKGFARLNGKLVEFNAYALDISSDSNRVNVMCASDVNILGDAPVDPTTDNPGSTPVVSGTVELPTTASFITEASASTALPEGWAWVVQNNKGAYATKYQSFRGNGEKIQSPSFEAQNGVKFSLKVYLNNWQSSATASSQIKAVAYNAEGTQIAEAISENINSWASGSIKTGDMSYSNTLEFNLAGEGITYVTFEFVKANGGNIGIMEAKIEGAN